MNMKVAVIMDPIESINTLVDTSFALMLEAQDRDWEVYYLHAKHLWLQDGVVWGHLQQLTLYDDPHHYFEVQQDIVQPLSDMDCILMRKDPPFTLDYIYLTYLLEHVEAQGTLVINKASSLRDANEKLFTTWFPQCCPNTLVSSHSEVILDFIQATGDCVIKPLDGMGGGSVYRLSPSDPNLNPLIEHMTLKDARMVMVQEFIPEIFEGDKRILMMNGEPAPYALARIPAKGDFRGNLSAGAKGVAVELNEQDLWICEQVGPTLKAKGLCFVGLDVIGAYLTEINVTSPTCAREIKSQTGFDACKEFFDYLETVLI